MTAADTVRAAVAAKTAADAALHRLLAEHFPYGRVVTYRGREWKVIGVSEDARVILRRADKPELHAHTSPLTLISEIPGDSATPAALDPHSAHTQPTPPQPADDKPSDNNQLETVSS